MLATLSDTESCTAGTARNSRHSSIQTHERQKHERMGVQVPAGQQQLSQAGLRCIATGCSMLSLRLMAQQRRKAGRLPIAISPLDSVTCSVGTLSNKARQDGLRL